MLRIALQVLAALALATSLTIAPAVAHPRRGDPPPEPYPYWDNRRAPPPGHEFREPPVPYSRWEDRNRPPPNWNDREWRLREQGLRRNGHNANEHDATAGLVLGTLLGFALGAAVVDSQEHQANATSRLNDPAWIAYCARRYQSFDPYTGTYFGSDGLRHFCR